MKVTGERTPEKLPWTALSRCQSLIKTLQSDKYTWECSKESPSKKGLGKGFFSLNEKLAYVFTQEKATMDKNNKDNLETDMKYDLMNNTESENREE